MKLVVVFIAVLVTQASACSSDPPALHETAPPAANADAGGFAGSPPMFTDAATPPRAGDSGGTVDADRINDAGRFNDAGGADEGGVDEPMFADPGTAPWQPVPSDEVAEQCGLDPELLTAADVAIGTPYAVIRYGKLCHEHGADSPTEAYSVTKTLGALVTGIAAYETRNIPSTGAKTGPLSDTDRADHWLDGSSITFNREARVAHMLAMLGHNTDLSYGNRSFLYDGLGNLHINRLGEMVTIAVAQEPARLGTDIEQFTQRFLYEALGMTDSTWTYDSETKNYGLSWTTTLHDMARVGLLILHRGVWNGRRVLDEAWTYKMTHPAFEDANTAYGYLTWLNARSGGIGPGMVISDPCSPPALWNHYPHGLSEAPDCRYVAAGCEQQHDVGVWSAPGLFGQFIVGHPGLDLVIVAKNYGGLGPTGLWNALRPALVALDPLFAHDEQAFCAAYGDSKYAPDLKTPAIAP